MNPFLNKAFIMKECHLWKIVTVLARCWLAVKIVK